MPVTPAHAVVAVPSWRRGRWWTAALVAGSVAPDLSHFRPFARDTPTDEHLRDAAHTLLGALTIDLVAGLGLLAAWVVLVRPTLLDWAPDFVVARVVDPAEPPRGRKLWFGVIVAVAAGTVSHVALDWLVHRTFVVWSVPEFDHLSGGQILQYGLSTLGLAWLAWEAVRFLGRSRRPVPRVVGAVSRTGALLVFAVIAVAAACGRLGEFASPRNGFRLYATMAFQGTVRAVGVVCTALLSASVAWVGGRSWAARRVRPGGFEGDATETGIGGGGGPGDDAERVGRHVEPRPSEVGGPR